MTASPTEKEIDEAADDLLPDRIREFTDELGLFALSFALVEHALFEVLRHQTKTMATARIIFAGTRADTAIGYVRKIASDSRMTKARKARLVDALDQAALLNKARNDILHYGLDFLTYSGNRLIVSNVHRSRSFSDQHVREFEVSPSMLKRMALDAWKVTFVLYEFSAIRRYGAANSNIHHYKWPWLYKPPAPVKRDHKSLLRLHKRKRQPRSSPKQSQSF